MKTIREQFEEETGYNCADRAGYYNSVYAEWLEKRIDKILSPPSDLKELKDWDEVFKEFSNKNASNKYQEAPNYAFLHFLKDNYPAPVYFPVQRAEPDDDAEFEEWCSRTRQESPSWYGTKTTSELYGYFKEERTKSAPLPSVNEKEAVEREGCMVLGCTKNKCKGSNLYCQEHDDDLY